MAADDTARRITRRAWLSKAGSAAVAGYGLSLFPPIIEKALAVPPASDTGSLQDVQHVVILMLENRSFDHYFGTMSGVRGFGDRILVPTPGDKSVWLQSDGEQDILPFHLDTQTTKAMRVPSTPHAWGDAHKAWNDGRFGEWPRYKQFQSMGYYEADDIPFQRALAEAFTVCDAHHCSVQSGTLSNRVMFITGSNVEPNRQSAASEPLQAVINNDNNRGALNGPYAWTTYPERLQAAGVSWRVYQDPEDNWDGVLAPWESFVAYRDIGPGNPLFDNAMTNWSLDDLGRHVMDGTLPQVSWIVPSALWSEHPAESSPLQGAAYTQRVLERLVANPEVWARTVFIVTFDENDGFFDHVPPPAPPSIGEDGRTLGGSTLPDASMAGLYYRNEVGGVLGTRPFGLGPRVPLYIISPWSRGGWVCSEVFDHTSTIRFLEARFGVKEPNISAWHRAISGDLTSCLDFSRPNTGVIPELPDVSWAPAETLVIHDLPNVTLPKMPRMPTQDPGVRYSRALPYRLAMQVTPALDTKSLELEFENTGTVGAVFHVYDRLRLDEPPWRYTVEAGKTLNATWPTKQAKGQYDMHVMGPNGFLWEFAGRLEAQSDQGPLPEVRLVAKGDLQSIDLMAWNLGHEVCDLSTRGNAYRSDRAIELTLMPKERPRRTRWSVTASGFWYDFSVSSPSLPGWSRRFAGRVEIGRHGISDPALGGLPDRCEDDG
jgi:phospholipase C